MSDYTFKTYVTSGREYFVYGDDCKVTKKDFPFLESLLDLLYLNVWKYEPLIKDMEHLIRKIYQSDDVSYIKPDARQVEAVG